jgi:hypothetical protein
VSNYAFAGKASKTKVVLFMAARQAVPEHSASKTFVAPADFGAILRIMDLDWQQLVSLSIVGATAVLMLRSRLQRPKFSFARDTHCGCGSMGNHAIPQHSVVYHVRKGERPRIVVKMK